MASPAAAITAYTAPFASKTTRSSHASHATAHTAAHAATNNTRYAAHRTTCTLTLLTCRHLSPHLLQSHSIHADTLVVEEAISSVSSHSWTSASHRTFNLFGHSVGRIVFTSLAHVKPTSIAGIPAAFTIQIEVHVVQRLGVTLKIIASWSKVEILWQIAFLLGLGGDRLHMMIVSLSLTAFHNKLVNFMI